MLSIFQSQPGSSLKGINKETFLNLKLSLDQCILYTTEPNQDLNESCALLVCTEAENTIVLNEIVFYLRRLMGQPSDPKRVITVLQLINCIAFRAGAPFFEAIDNVKFVNKLKKLAKALRPQTGLAQNALVMLLEAIQRWTAVLIEMDRTTSPMPGNSKIQNMHTALFHCHVIPNSKTVYLVEFQLLRA